MIHNDAIFVIAPPYTAGGKSAGSRLYTHSIIDHDSLFAACAKLKGDFLMTYDNAPEVCALAHSRARERYEDICLKLADLVNGRKLDDLLKPEKARAEQYRKVQLSSLESLMNSYENACAKYRDDKIDKDRFKKLYIEEIRTLFAESDNCYSRYLHPEGTSKFKAIWAVYRAWNDLENKQA